jgi:4-hydroxy 2-oxovalerate aldolase
MDISDYEDFHKAVSGSEIKIMDCTIRDGGLMNNHLFKDETVKAVYDACVASGIDYMEIGYKNSTNMFPPSGYGAWKFCREDDLRRIVGENDTQLKLSAMADAEKSNYRMDILPKDQSVLDMIRVAAYIHQIPLALDMIRDAHDKGYETAINLMAISVVPDDELNKALELLASSEVTIFYIVDSYGALYPGQTRSILKNFQHHASSAGKQVGIHIHNNRQLALANTLEAINLKANMLDASMAGCGRGAGNCHIELLMSFLQSPKYSLRPVLECIQNHIEPMREKLLWGYDISYMMTGLLNIHPGAAMEFNLGSDKGDIVKLFNLLAAREEG